MLTHMNIRAEGFVRPLQRGDIVSGGGEIVATLTTAGAGTLTGALLANTILSRTGPGGPVADTVDTADAIVAALGTDVVSGDSYRLRYINNTAFAITVTGVTGVTVTNGVVNASSVKDFLITLDNATRASVTTGTTTNGSAVIIGMSAAATALITPGQLIVGTGIPANATVLAVNPGVGVTISANATATGSLVSLTFNPKVTVLGLGQGLL